MDTVIRLRIFWYISALLICLLSGVSATLNLGPVSPSGYLLHDYTSSINYTIVSRGTFDSSVDKAKPANWVKCIPSQQLVNGGQGSINSSNPGWQWAGNYSSSGGDYIIYPIATYMENQWGWLLPGYKKVSSIIENLVKNQVDYSKRIDQWTKTYIVIFAPIKNPVVQKGIGKYLTDISTPQLAINVPAGSTPDMQNLTALKSTKLTLAWSQEPVDTLTGVNLKDKYYYVIMEIEDSDYNPIITFAFYNGQILAEWKCAQVVNKLTVGK